MTEIVHADIFFFITSVAVVVVTLGFVAVLYYVIPIVRDVREIVGKVRKAGESVEKDFETLRANVREEGKKGKMLVDLVLGWAMHALTPRTRRKAKKDEPPSSQL
jgi:predicted PurR-regulated permease PerM